MPTRRFIQVDVFTETPFCGNPLAVILDGHGLTGDQMQAIAREMNLSETTLILPPTDASAHVKVRIFTPQIEPLSPGIRSSAPATCWSQKACSRGLRRASPSNSNWASVSCPSTSPVPMER
jgi:hypothetical protein